MALGPSGSFTILEPQPADGSRRGAVSGRGHAMDEGALVTTRSTVPLWQHPLFVERCMEAVTAIHQLVESVAPVTLRFDSGERGIRAELACQNHIFAVLSPLERIAGSTSPHPLLIYMAPDLKAAGRLTVTQSELEDLLRHYLISRSYEFKLHGKAAGDLFASMIWKK